MNLLKKLSNNAEPEIVNGLIVCMCILACGLSWSIGRSRNVRIEPLGISLTNQVVESQKDLDKALLLIELQKKAQDRAYEEAQDFTRKYPVGLKLLKELEEARLAVPVTEIQELEESLQESEEVIESLEDY